MAKPTLKKKTVVAPVVVSKPANNKRLIQKTPAELRELIGEDTKIGVSLKELVAITTSGAKAAAKAALLA
jgi:hypothetical protein